jgi:hypothetical protein
MPTPPKPKPDDAGTSDDAFVRLGTRLLLAGDVADTAPDGASPPDRATILARLKALEPALRSRGLASLALFGSVAAGSAGPGSDIDILVEVAPESAFGLLDLVDLQTFLTAELGHPANVAFRDTLHWVIRDRVRREAITVF